MVSEIAHRLADDFEIVVYCAGDAEDDEDHVQAGFQVRTFRGFSDIYHFSPNLCRELRRAKSDLIHVHNFSSFMPLAASLAKGKSKLIFSPHFHIVGSRPINRFLRRVYDPLLGRSLFEKADAVVSFSNTERYFIHERFGVPFEKITVVHHGTTFPKTQNSADNTQLKTILYAGRLEKYKNVHLIIPCLRHLPEEYGLCVIGTGGYESHLKQLTRNLGLEPRVKFLGYVKDEEMRRHLVGCSVFVQLSEIESGISISCIEALATGKPVIVNDSLKSLKEMVELFGDRGVYGFDVSKNGPEELAKMVQGVEGRQFNVDVGDWSWDKSARDLKALYCRVLNGYDGEGQHE
jgi:glycosyltransferase involved in cell wall biosynthesis